MLESALCRIPTKWISTHDCNDFDRTEPKLELSKELDTEVVDCNDGHQKDCNPNTRIDFFSGLPFLENQSGGGKLVRRRNNVLAPISPLGVC